MCDLEPPEPSSQPETADGRTSRGRLRYTCGSCGHVAYGLRRHKEHVWAHTGERPFYCHLCPQRFRQRRVLNDHLLAHTGARPYKCPKCPRMFSRRSNLYRHQRNSSHQ
ncbi:hypothetical protein HPB50_010077 [Hyalomma asiaticum]|uniref:Uncharacterized protein n=1 Tax=Hyalomma asiaticum TaxID=266040 RepID=A0ACB7RQ02_HYAAI|nr:hypothetical protein HPB50_010077 [Hyalomma asiaticum]